MNRSTNGPPAGLTTRAVSFRIATVLLALVGCRAEPVLEWPAPEGWTTTETTTYTVPGKPLAAWTGPSDSSFVAYTTLPDPGATAETLARGEANRYQAHPGAADIQSEVVRLSGDVDAARIELVAPGYGDTLAPPITGLSLSSEAAADGADDKSPDTDLIPTRRVLLAIPRSRDVLWLSWNFPESAGRQLLPEVDRQIDELRIPPAARQSP